MAFSTGKNSVSFDEIKGKVTDADLVFHYLGITKIPCFIHSPLRKDNRPSFGFYSRDGEKIHWIDLATREGGGMYDLLSLMWHCDYKEVLARIQRDITSSSHGVTITSTPCDVKNMQSYQNSNDLKCRIRKWRQYDIDYWASYGVPLEWLEYAEVYPISHKIVISNGKKYVFNADKLAYAFVEHKEGKVTLKIYQPHSENPQYKWSNKHDRSVISLWTKVPEKGEKLVICSSLKDALCLWANTGIPALALQGEGYGMSDTAINELKIRYKKIIISYDGDAAGILDAKKLSEKTGFIYRNSPIIGEAKDWSDIYKIYGKKRFLEEVKKAFANI